MQVTKEGIEQIKTANDLAGVLTERGIAVKRKGESLVASCPFHEEKTPSFTVTPSKGLFHCFGCGVSGDVIGFVSRYDKVSFKEALEMLAQRAGLSIEKAMEEGYSTATDEMREMGFGAGMGLPNIKKNSDKFEISSTPGQGTSLKITMCLDQKEEK